MSFTSRLAAEKPLECVDMGTGAAPFLVGIPLEFLLQGRGQAPAMGETELGEHRAGCGQAEVLDEILPQNPHGHGVEQERALPGKPNDAPSGSSSRSSL